MADYFSEVRVMSAITGRWSDSTVSGNTHTLIPEDM
jgi:hypothetical protein